MIIDGENLILSIDSFGVEADEILAFIKPRLEYIDEISFEEEISKESPITTQLLQFLISLKKSKPSLKIDLIDTLSFESVTSGMVTWSDTWTPTV
jgi:hypothetical protein